LLQPERFADAATASVAIEGAFSQDALGVSIAAVLPEQLGRGQRR